MKEASQAVSPLSKAGSPAELAAKKAELAESAFEKSVATMREMAEILVKSSQEATETINARIAATVVKIRSLGVVDEVDGALAREQAAARSGGRSFLAP